jgi:hypothetical protein
VGAVGTRHDARDAATAVGEQRSVPVEKADLGQWLLPLRDRGLDHIQRGFGTWLALGQARATALRQAQTARGRRAHRIDLQHLALDLRGGDGFLRPFGELQFAQIDQLKTARHAKHPALCHAGGSQRRL